jgi:hypothetical protein
MSYDVLTPSAARLWPYAPDWSRSFDVTRSYKTDIFTSRDGTEQRRAIRDAPRLSAQYKTVVSDADRRAADLHLRAWEDKPVVVPDFARWARLTGSSIAGSTTLTISPMPVWVEADQPLVLCKAGVQELVTVIGVVGSTITLDDPLVNAWAIDDVLRPSFFGLFASQMSSSRINGGSASFDVSIDCYPGRRAAARCRHGVGHAQLHRDIHAAAGLCEPAFRRAPVAGRPGRLRARPNGAVPPDPAHGAHRGRSSAA